MAKVYVSIGSNIEREYHICVALDALADDFGILQISSVFESESVGFEGDAFLNLVVGFDTPLSIGGLLARLKNVEAENGRVVGAPKFSSRTLDIDILTYDDTVGEVDGVVLPRSEILKNAFVLWPLAEVAGAVTHPEVNKTYAQLWGEFERSQALHPISFIWRGEKISPL